MNPFGRVRSGCEGLDFKSIFIKKEFTIPDIAQATNFSVTTVAKHVAELQEKNLLELVDRVKTNKRGRRPALYRVKSEACSFLGWISSRTDSPSA